MDTESYRLEGVKKFLELDPNITKDLDDIVDLASQICNAPLAFISLIDEDTQWFKATKGFEVSRIPLQTAFCKYIFDQDDVIIAPDLLNDERYKDNPKVTGEPYIRFYAGSPLITKDGFTVGSLCVLDIKPRGLNEYQQNALKTLSKQVVNLMELNWNLKVLAQQYEQTKQHQQAVEDSELKLKALFDSTNDLHILINKDLQIIAFNRSATDYINKIHQRKIAIGDMIMDHADAKIKDQLTKYLAVAFTGKTTKHDWLLRPGTEYECWRQVKLMPIKNNTGEIIGVSINSTDITKRKQQEKQIIIQNDALTRIAIIQSHELRRPVASLLGMMNLMKMEQIDFGYFNMMEITINELDEKIRVIVKDSENTIQSHLAIVA